MKKEKRKMKKTKRFTAEKEYVGVDTADNEPLKVWGSTFRCEISSGTLVKKKHMPGPQSAWPSAPRDPNLQN